MQRTPVYNGHYFEVPMAFAVERFHCNFNTLTNNINKDFKKVNDWVTQW